MSHFYRGEVYRSTVWRQRLDATTNWAIVATAAALSFAFGVPGHSHVVFILTGLLVTILLFVESRRYRVFDVWRLRVRLLEEYFVARHLIDGAGIAERDWRRVLARDLIHPHFKMSLAESVARRLRRNYCWVFLVIYGSWTAKLAMHPKTAHTVQDLIDHAAVGPVPGWLVCLCGFVHYAILLGLALWVERGRPERGELTEPRHGLFWRRDDDPDHLVDLFEGTADA